MESQTQERETRLVKANRSTKIIRKKGNDCSTTSNVVMLLYIYVIKLVPTLPTSMPNGHLGVYPGVVPLRYRMRHSEASFDNCLISWGWLQ